MRKIAAVLVAAATLGVAAQSAPADVPKPDYQVINYGPVKDFTCRTAPVSGVDGQYGAWGLLHRRLHGPAGLPVDELQQDLPRLRADDDLRRERGAPGHSERAAAGHPRLRQQSRVVPGQELRGARVVLEHRLRPHLAGQLRVGAMQRGARAPIDFQPRVEQLRDQHALRAVAVRERETRRRGPDATAGPFVDPAGSVAAVGLTAMGPVDRALPRSDGAFEPGEGVRRSACVFVAQLGGGEAGLGDRHERAAVAGPRT